MSLLSPASLWDPMCSEVEVILLPLTVTTVRQSLLDPILESVDFTVSLGQPSSMASTEAQPTQTCLVSSSNLGSIAVPLLPSTASTKAQPA
jgi:hypothetical protein